MTLSLLILVGLLEFPPFPTAPNPVLQSPKHTEQALSLGAPMAKAAVTLVPDSLTTGFRITNLTVLNGLATLKWQEGVPPFQVQSSAGKGWYNVGEQTTNRSASFSVQGPTGFYRVQSIGSTPPTDGGVTLGMGGMNFPTKMAHREDGLHGLLRGLYGSQNDLFLWHDLSDLRSISMPGNPTSAGCVTDFFSSNRLAYAERAGSTNRVIEWSFDAGITVATVVTNFGFEHPYSVICSCTLSNRPVIISADNDSDADGNQMGMMFLWKDAGGAWQTKRLIMESSTAPDKLPTSGLSAVEYHGAVYAFFSRDSSGAIGLVKLSGEPLSVLYSNANWLNRYPQTNDATLNISGEAPAIWAAVDAQNDRIVLAYQCLDGELWTCTGQINNSAHAHMSLVGLTSSDSPYLITETTWYDSHVSFGLIPVWADSTGITFDTQSWSLDCDWDNNGVQGARFDYSGSALNKTWFIPGANVEILSYSDDGWLVIFTNDWMNHLCLAK